MSARVVSIREFTPRPGEYSLLVSELPGRGMQTIGVLLLDAENNELYVRLRRDWSALASEEDAEVLAALEDDLTMQYIIRYISNNTTEKSYRNVKVVVDLGNVKVRARKGYYASGVPGQTATP